MSGHVKAFKKKLAVFSADLEQGKLKYFPQLQKHFTSTDLTHDQKQNAFNKYVLLMKEAKNVMLERFAHFRELDATLQFILFPRTIQFENLELPKFEWLCLTNLDMEMMDFHESAI